MSTNNLPSGYQMLGLNQNIRAERDVMVFVTIKADNGVRGTVFLDLIANNGQVTTISEASVHLYTSSDSWIPFNSLSGLVKAGTNFKIRIDSNALQVNAYQVAIND